MTPGLARTQIAISLHPQIPHPCRRSHHCTALPRSPPDGTTGMHRSDSQSGGAEALSVTWSGTAQLRQCCRCWQWSCRCTWAWKWSCEETQSREESEMGIIMCIMCCSGGIGLQDTSCNHAAILQPAIVLTSFSMPYSLFHWQF
ncbi:hypothetical protein M758_10G011500 [Ceratodon purpureus]|uniref:Uncharacterized protein n=1 Tax=Ceratodon purpureus TaxID=3225 RepID=A0A8T0GJ55_CERPU|nr:hypothetical protein KC19_10G012400 [Ceratodon purpureus]KAG0602392.1 hypothetical protein M758_10G011500 [Ceratodon purpureus]